MHKRFTEEAIRATVLAIQDARILNHQYVGTEHLLLGLVRHRTFTVSGILLTLGVDKNLIRQEIERLVQRGPEVVFSPRPLFTPRAKRAIELAEEEAWNLQQDQIGPEHLLLGLLREEEGVAGQVLVNLGLKLETIREHVLKSRMMQLRLVERVVRLVRAGVPRKRRMREELLAHLTAIYDEELTRVGDPKQEARLLRREGFEVRKRFTEEARRAVTTAKQEARLLHHQYVGTEHLLLALVRYPTCVSGALQTLGVDKIRIRQEVERFVQRGPEVVVSPKPRLTPRAKRVIELAEEEAWNLQQDQIGPEHLLLGLLREEEGLAAQILFNLKLRLEAVRELVLKFRLRQLKLVERIVRPVRVSTSRKRKMREELLAHLTAIYDEELARSGDPAAAMQHAAERFGEPTELTRDLQSALPILERVGYYFDERLGGWRAPESSTRWMARLATQAFCPLIMMTFLVAAFAVAEFGWNVNAWTVLRPIVAFTLLLPIVEFMLGSMYFKVRDTIFGVFGSRKSWLRSYMLAVLMGLVVFLAGLSFVALAHWDL